MCKDGLEVINSINSETFTCMMNMTSEPKNVKLAIFISCIFLVILIKPTAKHNGEKKSLFCAP